MKQKAIFLALMTAATLSATRSMAQVEASALTTTSAANLETANSESKAKLDEVTGKKADKKFSADITLEQSSSLLKQDQYERVAEMSLSVAPSFDLGNQFKLSSEIAVSQEETGVHNSSMANTPVSLSYSGFQINDHMKIKNSLTGVLPTNQESRDRDRLYGAVSVGNGVSIDYLSPVKISYTLSVGKNFHQYTVNADGTPNVSYKLTHALVFASPLTKKLNLNVEGRYISGWTYHDYNRNSFLFAAELAYDVAENFSVSVGTSNEGSTLKADGHDSNIQAFDDKSSIIKAGLSYTY